MFRQAHDYNSADNPVAFSPMSAKIQSHHIGLKYPLANKYI